MDSIYKARAPREGRGFAYRESTRVYVMREKGRRAAGNWVLNDFGRRRVRPVSLSLSLSLLPCVYMYVCEYVGEAVDFD